MLLRLITFQIDIKRLLWPFKVSNEINGFITTSLNPFPKSETGKFNSYLVLEIVQILFNLIGTVLSIGAKLKEQLVID